MPRSKPAARKVADSCTSTYIRDEQKLLDLFASSFSTTLSSENFLKTLQEIKEALFNRDFAAAFGREDRLQAYAARWSPTRALCYAAVFEGITDHLNKMSSAEARHGFGEQEQARTAGDLYSDRTGNDQIPTKRLTMVSLGGCAAEHAAFALYIKRTSFAGTLTLIDAAPWEHSINLLQDAIASPPAISGYASAALRAPNYALLPPRQLAVKFVQEDILRLGKEELEVIMGKSMLVVTLMFTLNELYTESGLAKTTQFLAKLGYALPDDSLLLVVDSPGSYSEASIGKDKRRYPMQWLLDHTLLEKSPPGCIWEKLESHDSVWFRLPEGLAYPIKLENMRYQMHLYRLQRQMTPKVDLATQR